MKVAVMSIKTQTYNTSLAQLQLTWRIGALNW